MTEWRPNYAMPSGSGDAWADEYERGRPGYPADAVNAAGLGPEATVLDLGAGTGKLTRLLLGTFGRVIAVEPAEPMRRVLARRCADAEIADGTAERIPLTDASVDAVFAAEAFHHFHGSRSVSEISRVLRPGGALVLLWNIPDGPLEPPIESIEELVEDRGLTRDALGYDPIDLNSPRVESGEWRRAFDDAPFAPLEERWVAHEQTLDREGLLAFLASMGWLADLPDEERLPLLERIRSLLDADVYRRPWRTRVCWTRRD